MCAKQTKRLTDKQRLDQIIESVSIEKIMSYLKKSALKHPSFMAEFISEFSYVINENSLESYISSLDLSLKGILGQRRKIVSADYNKMQKTYNKLLKSALEELLNQHYRESILLSLAVFHHWKKLDKDSKWNFSRSTVSDFPLQMNINYVSENMGILFFQAILNHLAVCLSKMMPMQRDSVVNDMLSILSPHIHTESEAKLYVKLISFFDGTEYEKDLLEHFKIAIQIHLQHKVNYERSLDITYFLNEFRKLCLQLNQLEVYLEVIYPFKELIIYCTVEYLKFRKIDETRWHAINKVIFSKIIAANSNYDRFEMAQLAEWILDNDPQSLTLNELENAIILLLEMYHFSKEAEQKALAHLGSAKLKRITWNYFHVYYSTIYHRDKQQIELQVAKNKRQMLQFFLKYEEYETVSKLLVNTAVKGNLSIKQFASEILPDLTKEEVHKIRSLFRGFIIHYELANFQKNRHSYFKFGVSKYEDLTFLLQFYYSLESDKERVRLCGQLIIKRAGFYHEVKSNIEKFEKEFLSNILSLAHSKSTYEKMFKKLDNDENNPLFMEIAKLRKMNNLQYLLR